MGKFVVVEKVKPIRKEVPKAIAIKPIANQVNFPLNASLPLPASVCKRMGDPATIVGFDIETHDWLERPSRRSRIGDFGWHTQADEDNIDAARIVQMAWSIGTQSIPETIKSYVIRPEGFVISHKATAFHGISQEYAEHGKPLQEVLEEFMHDLMLHMDVGGKVVAHHLEFDAGVIYREFKRCGLNSRADEWMRLARQGFCTKSPELGCWLKQACGEQVAHENAKHSMGLLSVCQKLLPEVALPRDVHNAGTDANMCRLVYLALLERRGQLPKHSHDEALSQ